LKQWVTWLAPASTPAANASAEVLADAQQAAVGREQAGGVQAAGALERGLAQPVGQRREQAAIDLGPGRRRVRVHGDLLERALAADAARRAGVEAAGARVAQQRALDLDRVGRQVAGQPGPPRPVDQPLGVQEAQRELLVMAGRAHGHRERRAVDADLERLLDRHEVLLAVAHDLRPHAVGDLIRGAAGGGHRSNSD
jgi:hypothetical protein